MLNMEINNQRLTMNARTIIAIVVIAFLGLATHEVSAHGRLIEPPSRSSMWRYGFNSTKNYDDNAGFCGGYDHQWNKNQGKCGICGDPWDMLEPRDNERGGKYGQDIIVRRYKTGSMIPVNVELTANHLGYFEFRTCAVTHKTKDVSLECLDEHLLVGENGFARFYPGTRNGVLNMFYKLPDTLTCNHCVFQWRYIAGNNWGECGNGIGAIGCGPQEEFRACADIAIGDNEATLPPLPRPTNRLTTKPTPTSTILSTTKTSQAPTESTELSDYERPAMPVWLCYFIIAGTCFLVVLIVIALFYVYYYRTGRVHRWLARLSEQPLR